MNSFKPFLRKEEGGDLLLLLLLHHHHHHHHHCITFTYWNCNFVIWPLRILHSSSSAPDFSQGAVVRDYAFAHEEFMRVQTEKCVLGRNSSLLRIFV